MENEFNDPLEELTDAQAQTLCVLILYGKKHGWRLMHPKELAHILHINEGAAQKRISRLVKKHPDCFICGREKILNEPNLCTEKESSIFFLKIAEIANNSVDGMIHDEVVRDCLLEMNTIDSIDEAINFINMAISAGYLEKVPIKSHFIRMANKYDRHKKLIELLSKDCQQ